MHQIHAVKQFERRDDLYLCGYAIENPDSGTLDTFASFAKINEDSISWVYTWGDGATDTHIN